MFPVFPLIPVCGAIGVDCAQKLAEKLYKFFVEIIYTKSASLTLKLLRWDYQGFLSVMGFLIILVAGVIGCSRIVALHYGRFMVFDTVRTLLIGVI